MPRNFPCPETEDPCDRLDCTKSNCRLESNQTARLALAALSPEEEEINHRAAEVAVRIARHLLKSKNITLTNANIRFMTNNRNVQQKAKEIARQEIADLKNLL